MYDCKPFRIRTYEKHGGGGGVAHVVSVNPHLLDKVGAGRRPSPSEPAIPLASSHSSLVNSAPALPPVLPSRRCARLAPAFRSRVHETFRTCPTTRVPLGRRCRPGDPRHRRHGTRRTRPGHFPGQPPLLPSSKNDPRLCSTRRRGHFHRTALRLPAPRRAALRKSLFGLRPCD